MYETVPLKARVRKATIALEKFSKEYRKASFERPYQELQIANCFYANNQFAAVCYLCHRKSADLPLSAAPYKFNPEPFT